LPDQFLNLLPDRCVAAPQAANQFRDLRETAGRGAGCDTIAVTDSIASRWLAMGTLGTMALRIFISYSSLDRLEALRVKEIAESDGHDVWMDQFDITPGAALTQALKQGISAVDVLCLLISPTAVASAWVRQEIQYAISAESGQLSLLPILVRAAPIPDELADTVAIDAMRGLDDEAVVARIRRALGGDIDDALLLDATRRAELADHSAVAAAEQRWPTLRESLDRVIDRPIRELNVSVDQDTWPDVEGTVVEIVLHLDIFKGALHILLAPYVEGRTWPPDSGLEELPAQRFLGSTDPRVDGRLIWAGRTVLAVISRDGTDLGERPTQVRFSLLGDDYTGAERAHTMALLERFELPSLRQLIDARSTVTVWRHSSDGGQSQRVDPAQTDLRLRLEAPLRHDETGLFGFRLWSFHDREDAVLLRAPTLTDCATDLEREALLSLYRNVPLRAEQNSEERWRRLATAVERGEPVDEVDRWAAFTLAVGRADVPRLRGAHAQAAQLVHDALGLLDELDLARLGYSRAFRLITALSHLVNDLAEGGGTESAISHYSNQTVQMTRRLWDVHPEEADYGRALSRALFQRARSRPATPVAVSDIREAVGVLDTLQSEHPLPWRIEEARRMRLDAEALLAQWKYPPAALDPPSGG
jgi:hypothetical protein